MFEAILRIKDTNLIAGLKRSLEWQIKYMGDQVKWAKAQTCTMITVSDGTTKERLQWISETEEEIVGHEKALTDLDK